MRFINPVLFVGIVLLITFSCVAAVSACEQGCTPGYWKNHPEAWPTDCRSYGIITPDQVIGGFEVKSGFVWPDGVEETFMEALSYKGGPGIEGAQRILLRAGVAAYLNGCAFYPDYHSQGYTLNNINAVWDSDRQTILDLANLMDIDNNAGCPL